MLVWKLMGGMSRRSVLYALAGGTGWAAVRKAETFPPERVRYLDPSTEFPVLRLTSPEHSSWLPAPAQRAVSKRRTFLLFSSDRTGSPQLFQMVLTTGEYRQLTGATDLDSSTPTLAADDRSVFFFDGSVLRQLSLSTLRDRELYRLPAGWRRTPGLNVSRENTALLVETNGTTWRLVEVPVPVGTAQAHAKAPEPRVVAEYTEAVTDPQIRPGHTGALLRKAAALTLAPPDAATGRDLPLARGRTGQAFWSADGQSVLYLSTPETPGQQTAIRECLPDTAADRQVALTTQFAVFAPNSDASVFIGASGSKASPYIFLLLRVTRRELALCEHRASDPVRAAPVFSSDSQRVFFQSDRHGKPAIYTLGIDRLVERTGT